MLFQWPTFDQMIYRLMRLRRLIAVAVSIPLLVLMAVSLADPSVISAGQATVAAMGLALVVVAHVVLFPNVTIESLALSVALTVLVLLMPLMQQLSLWAPVKQQSGALALLIGFAMALTGVLVVLLQIALGALAYGGPVVRRVLHLRQALPCSARRAFQQLALRPEARRGRILTGPADDNGFFEVAVATADADGMDDCVTVDAKVLDSTAERHDVMLLSRTGAVTVTSLGFEDAADGCIVDVRDMPGDFTLGMYVLFWLTDQQADNLTEMTDGLLGHEPRANGLAHHRSLVAAAGAILSPRAPMID